nr:PaaI family thioesterase [Actinomadura rugatobispora]
MEAAYDPTAGPGADLWNTLSGADLIQAMGDGRFPEISGVNTHIGQAISRAVPGRVEIDWTPGERLTNPGGAVHGGYIAMILDNAVCLAGSSTCEHFMPMLTLSLNVDYLRAAMPGDTYRVVGTCVHPGRTRMVSNAVVTDAQDRLVAQASAAVVPNRAFAR